MSNRTLRSSLGLLLLLGTFAAAPGCAAGSVDVDVDGNEDDLTSITARSRTLEFMGTVYVDPGASNDAILTAALAQARTAFGPLRTAGMAVNTRELRAIDARTFVKRKVNVVDPTSTATKDMIEVKYTYRDNAVVSLDYKDRSSAPLALMNPNYTQQTERILKECTRNDSDARDFASSIWYVFEPSLKSCKSAIAAEQAIVDKDRALLQSPKTQVARSEVERLYLPITAKLGPDKTNQGNTYPEYDRLFSGGVAPGKLVVSMIFGLIDHNPGGGPETDQGWSEMMDALDTLFQEKGEFKQVAGPSLVDLSSFTLASGKVITAPAFSDLVGLETGNSSLTLTTAEKKELKTQFASRLNRNWVALERPVRVQIGKGAPNNFAVQLLVYFGASSYDSTPHKFATKNSDVFIYNGHSSIGYGPLDPKNFTKSDFPSTYQLMWIDGCVSYNYYEKDYIPLKNGGTKNLDLVTNGTESPSWRSGYANGKFLSALLGGNASYLDLLRAAKDTEALRVVDGELDNKYSPTKVSSRVTVSYP